MKFEEALQALRDGKRVTRKQDWGNIGLVLHCNRQENTKEIFYFHIDKTLETEVKPFNTVRLCSEDLLAEDWEVINEAAQSSTE